MVLINYFFLHKVYQTKSKRWMQISIVVNLLNLGFFKYFYFLIDIISNVSSIPFNQQLASSSLQIILPLAISFYTFQIIAFTVDVYKDKFTEPVSLLNYAVFIMFFPQLIAGPIMRPDNFIPQLTGQEQSKNFSSDYLSKGLSLIALGMLKKVLLADSIAEVVDPIWADPSKYSSLSCIAAIYGFTWQIYCDFSGYTDIARGCAFLLGYDIPENFRSPYLADSPRDLWQRWHVTLSTWLRDYVYIPLGGSRNGELRNYYNLVLTFTLGGLWHGANWTYILWGFYHGVVLAMERILEQLHITLLPKGKLGKLLGIFFVFHIFTFGAVMFRAKNITDFGIILKNIFQSANETNVVGIETVFYLCFAAFIIQVIEYKQRLPLSIEKHKYAYITFSYLLLLILIGLYTSTGKEFVYFQF
jgi:alginate O-acetyltransferase complex protein AlgI